MQLLQEAARQRRQNAAPAGIDGRLKDRLADRIVEDRPVDRVLRGRHLAEGRLAGEAYGGSAVGALFECVGGAQDGGTSRIPGFLRSRIRRYRPMLEAADLLFGELFY